MAHVVGHLMLAAAVGIPVAAIFSTRAAEKGARRRTLAEWIVRALFRFARWATALAEGADAFVMRYREKRYEPLCGPACDSYRPWEVAR